MIMNQIQIFFEFCYWVYAELLADYDDDDDDDIAEFLVDYCNSVYSMCSSHIQNEIYELWNRLIHGI